MNLLVVDLTKPALEQAIERVPQITITKLEDSGRTATTRASFASSLQEQLSNTQEKKSNATRCSHRGEKQRRVYTYDNTRMHRLRCKSLLLLVGFGLRLEQTNAFSDLIDTIFSNVFSFVFESGTRNCFPARPPVFACTDDSAIAVTYPSPAVGMIACGAAFPIADLQDAPVLTIPAAKSDSLYRVLLVDTSETPYVRVAAHRTTFLTTPVPPSHIVYTLFYTLVLQILRVLPCRRV